MAYRGSFYYDDYDYENYPDDESLVDYEHNSVYDEIDDDQRGDTDLDEALACSAAVSHQIATQLLILLCVNLVYRLVRQSNLPNFCKHLSSSLLGYCSTFVFFDSGNSYICLLVFMSYSFLKILQYFNVKRQGFHMIFLQITLIFACEIYEWRTANWQHVRGSALIISMKAISLAFDISSTRLPRLPPIYEYAGYALCPANLVLGPFVTFTAYANCRQQQQVGRHRFGVPWRVVGQIVLNCALSMVFINLSSCFLHYMISASYLRIFGTYRDALVFRCSHYFVSFLSSATLLVSGVGIEHKQSSDVLGFEVSKPLDVELPRSLIPVVVSWNIPIHLWVKTYIFRNVKRYGKFNAILLTYLVSSSLHGLNFQLAAVLLSIGIFTFVEFHLRNSLAEILDACVAASKCNVTTNQSTAGSTNDDDGTARSNNVDDTGGDSSSRRTTAVTATCISKGHRNTTALAWVKMINFIFGLFTIVLLAYLGVLLDISSEQHGKGFSWEHSLKKWIELKFFGHIIVAIWFIIYLVLKH